VEDTFAQLLSRHTGQPLAAALADVRAGRNFGPADAIAYGLADHIR
jgi:ATP-dependent protease ClpP protease subunit